MNELMEIVVGVLAILFGIAGFVLSDMKKNIRSAHERIDTMNDVVVRNIDFDRLREDIKSMENKIINRIDHIEKGSFVK